MSSRAKRVSVSELATHLHGCDFKIAENDPFFWQRKIKVGGELKMFSPATLAEVGKLPNIDDSKMKAIVAGFDKRAAQKSADAAAAASSRPLAVSERNGSIIVPGIRNHLKGASSVYVSFNGTLGVIAASKAEADEALKKLESTPQKSK